MRVNKLCKAMSRATVKNRGTVLFAGLAAVTAATAPGFAAPAAAQTARQESRVTLEEVVVTARKREESLQDVPISITAFDSRDIENFGIDSTRDISHSVPNFQFSRLTTLSNQLSIRGINSADSAPGFETGVAVILDDVYVGRAAAFSTSLLDIERIEVLRGPQGTLQGRNVIGGSVNIVTARPTSEPAAKIKASYGNYDQIDLRGVVSGPIAGDTLSGKIGFVRRERDGYGENVDLGKDLDTEDAWSFRGQLRFTPDDNLEILLTGDYDDFRMHDFHNDFGPCCVESAPEQLKDREVGGDVWNSGDRKVYGVAANIYYTFDSGYELASITSYRGYDVSIVQEGDPEQNFGAAGAGTFIATARNDQEQWQFSQELRLTSPAHESFNWLAGLYYYEDELENYQNFLAGFNLGTVIAGASTIDDSEVGTESYAAFGSMTYELSDIWSLTVGLRYTVNDREASVYEADGIDGIDPEIGAYVNMLTLADPAPTEFDAPIVYGITRNDVTDKEWTGDITLTQRWSEDVSTFVKYSRGFKGGGFNTSYNGGFSGTSVEAEKIDAYEIGLRSYLAGRKVRFNATAFYMEHSDQQVLVFDPATFRYVTRNEPTTETYGAELDLLAQVTRDLSVSLGVGLIDAEFTAGPNDGNEAPYTSEMSFSAGIQYSKPINDMMEFYFHNQTSWRDSYYMSTENASITKQPSYWWVTARIGFQDPAAKWSIGLYGRNLTDEDVFASISDVPGLFSVGFLQEPRTYGIDVQYRF